MLQKQSVKNNTKQSRQRRKQEKRRSVQRKMKEKQQKKRPNWQKRRREKQQKQQKQKRSSWGRLTKRPHTRASSTLSSMRLEAKPKSDWIPEPKRAPMDR